MPRETRATSTIRGAAVRPPGVPPPAGRWRRLAGWAKVVAAVVTFAIAVFGAITGYLSWQRSREVHVQVIPRQTGFDSRRVDVGLINSSERAVTVTGGTLRFDGYELGHIKQFVPGLGSGDSRSNAERLTDALRPPFPLEGGQALAGTLEWQLPEAGYSPAVLKAFQKYLDARREGGQPADGRFTLEVDIEPGDDVTEAIPLGVQGFDENTQPGHTTGWHTQLAFKQPGATVQAMTVYSEDTTPSVAAFTLWGPGRKPLLTAQRPVSRSVPPARFDMPMGLAAGRYAWAVSVNGEAVAVGSFSTPCKAAADAAEPPLLPSEDCMTP